MAVAINRRYDKARVSAKWERPDLGTFEFEDHLGWTKTVALPAFAVFVYDTGDRTASAPGTQELAFQVEDETDFPSEAAVALGRRILSNQTKLASAVAAALWDDFTGYGPDSGMVAWRSGERHRLGNGRAGTFEKCAALGNG